MILILVGTGCFDGLIQEMNRVALLGKVKEPIIAQIGEGKYEPTEFKFFRWAKDIAPYIKQASLVISHGGLGSLTQCLYAGKKVIGVYNARRTDSHQLDLLTKFSKEGYILWCKDLKTLPAFIENARSWKPKPYEQPECKIAEKIEEFLRQNLA